MSPELGLEPCIDGWRSQGSTLPTGKPNGPHFGSRCRGFNRRLLLLFRLFSKSWWILLRRPPQKCALRIAY